MDDAELSRLVAEIDAAVPREGALVRIETGGGILDESRIAGNRAGYLRLGVEFLKIAFAERQKGAADLVDADFAYLFDPSSEIKFDSFDRRDDLEPLGAVDEGRLSRVAQLGCLVLLVGFVLLAGVGLITAVSWLFH